MDETAYKFDDASLIQGEEEIYVRFIESTPDSYSIKWHCDKKLIWLEKIICTRSVEIHGDTKHPKAWHYRNDRDEWVLDSTVTDGTVYKSCYRHLRPWWQRLRDYFEGFLKGM